MASLKLDKREWHYDPTCDWYVCFVRTEKDNQIVVHKRTMHYYYGKTHIPKVKN